MQVPLQSGVLMGLLLWICQWEYTRACAVCTGSGAQQHVGTCVPSRHAETESGRTLLLGEVPWK